MKRILFALVLLTLVPAMVLGQNTTNQTQVDEKTTAQASKSTTNSAAEDSISGSEMKEKTVTEVALIYKIDPNQYADELGKYFGANIGPNSAFSLLHDNYGVDPRTAKDIALSLKTGEALVISESKEDGSKDNEYHLMEITLALLFAYFLGYLLFKRKIISLINHRRLWNILLLLTFFASGILGIMLVLKEDKGMVFPLPFNIVFWHSVLGIAVFVIGLIHTVERWYYFKRLFARKKRRARKLARNIST